MQRALLLLVPFLLFLGCAPSTGLGGKKVVSLDHKYSKKEYQSLYKRYQEENKTDDLLWNYKAGTVSYYLAYYPQSIGYFDNAESLIKKYDEEVLAGKLFANIGSLLTNDTFMDYRPKIYEKIMVNTYKGIDFILLGDKQNARIEFNRALVRQQRAKAFFAKEINQEKKKLAQEKDKKAQKGASLAQKAMKNKKTMDPIEKKYSNLFAFKPYPDFVNPFTTYLAGLYFLNVGDYRKATNLLKETYGMIKGLNDGDRYVLGDFKMAFNLKRSIRGRKQHYTWVIFFNGQGPIKAENKIEIPLFLFSDDVLYTGIALPTLKMRKRAYDYLLVSNGTKPRPTKTVASMDTIIKTEFKKRFDTILTRALMRTITQTVLQKQLKDKGGLLGAIAGAIYQASMNKADLRIWDTLPKEFQVVRLKTTKSIAIFTPDNQKIATIPTDPRKNYLVFVNIATKGSEPIVFYRAF